MILVTFNWFRKKSFMDIRKKKLVIEIEMESGASDALVAEHMNHFINTLLFYAKDQATESWNTTINADWEESYKVDITINHKIE